MMSSSQSLHCCAASRLFRKAGSTKFPTIDRIFPQIAMNSVAAEHLFQHSFEVGKVPTDRATVCNSPPFTHLGQAWSVRVCHVDNNLDVYLMPVDLKETITVNYGVRVILGDVVHYKSPKSIELKVDGLIFGQIKVITWEQLLAKFCINDTFTIEIVFPTFAEKRSNFTGSTLEDAVFKDVWIACKESDNKIHCNKSVIGRESQAMFAAFDNDTSEESLTKTFTIRHPCATVENVLLLVRAMYENWMPDLMDSHANELLQLADCYECRQVAHFAVESVKTQLTTPEHFWKTATVAVLLQVQQPTLIEACAKYADEQPNGLYNLLNRDDCADKDTIVGVVMAVAAMHK